MDKVAMSKPEAFDPESLIETDPIILKQVQKDLSEEYIRFMSLVLNERLNARPRGGTSLFDHLRKAASNESS